MPAEGADETAPLTPPRIRSAANYSPYRADIDGLRALAVTAVVLYHLAPGLLPGGFLGVDIFFVISGFLISGIVLSHLRDGTFSLGSFYLHRARRILPALLVVLAGMLFMGAFFLMPDEMRRLAKATIASLAFVPNLALLQEAGYFDPASELKPLLHLWSLGVEEQFYLLWPVLLVWLARHKGAFTVTGIGVLAAASFVAHLLVARVSPEADFYLPFTRFWELLAGAILAARQVVAPGASLGLPPAVPYRSAFLSLTGVALMIGSIVLTGAGERANVSVALWPVLGATLFIAAGPDALLNRTLFSLRAVVYLGLISYPLYLWHWPLLSFLRILHLEDVQLDRMLRVAAVALAFVLAVLVHHLIERPVRRRRLASMGFRLAIGVVLTATCAAAISSFEGLPGRTGMKTDPFGWPMELRRQERCVAMQGMNVEASREIFCARNDYSRRPGIVVLGDSHANALWPAIASLNPNESVIQIGAAACPFLRQIRYWHLDLPATSGDCPLLVDHSWRAIEPTTRIVILAARNSIYVSPEPNSRYFIDGGAMESVVDTGLDPVSAYERALERDLASLLAKGLEVVLVHQVPELDFSPRGCLRVRPIDHLFQTPARDCTIARAEVIARQSSYRAATTRVVERLQNFRVHVVDPMDALCDHLSCHAIVDAVLVYRDPNHLSVEGARLVWSRIAPRDIPSWRPAF